MKLSPLVMLLCILSCLCHGCSSSKPLAQNEMGTSVQAKVQEEDRLAAVASVDGDKAGALLHLRKAFAMDKSNLFIKSRLGMELRAAGQFQEAKKILTEVAATKTKPKSADRIYADAARKLVTNSSSW